MDSEAFERLIEGATETPNLDFKAASPWNVAASAKDILAMSNVQDGGYIVIGISEKPFARTGVDAAMSRSYDHEQMKDQMTEFADPHVRFDVFRPTDGEGKEYVVIRVHEFEETPVICRKDSKDTKRATLYYRNRNRRVESAPISNSHDLRDVILLATVKFMKRLRAFGFDAGDDKAKARLDEELGGL